VTRLQLAHPISIILWALVVCFSLPSALFAEPPKSEGSTSPTKSENQKDLAKWKNLKNSWVACEFGGDGSVEIGNESIKLGMGTPLTGIRWKGEMLRENYELSLEARRVDGLDFFCALTFPVGKDHVSFVLGGWGGGVVGISSIDGYDASENDTTMYQQFKKNQWYKVRVRVTAGAIECWIDDQNAVDQPRKGHQFDIRFEMDESLPLGVAAFQCKSELRSIRLRKLTDAEIKKAASEVEDESTLRGGGQ